jgi:hypothetical protein
MKKRAGGTERRAIDAARTLTSEQLGGVAGGDYIVYTMWGFYWVRTSSTAAAPVGTPVVRR